jgi:hypothetical protein
MVKLKCEICGRTFERKQCKVKRAEKHYCSLACRYIGQEAPKRKSLIEKEAIYLELTKGMIAQLDIKDKDLCDMNWQLNKGYAAKKNNKDRKHIYMHRVIMERMLGRALNNNEFVDHNSGDRLDNRRENLRTATKQENAANSRKAVRSGGKYKGISFDKNRGKWRARIRCYGIDKHIGYFYKEKDAAMAYDKEAIALFGDFAKLNFPDEWYASRIHRKNGCSQGVEAYA